MPLLIKAMFVRVADMLLRLRNQTGNCARTIFLFGAMLIAGVDLPCPALAQAISPDANALIPKTSVCPILVSAAHANALPVEFFARVIWQESRFQADAVGPLTRHGEHALGIAQFMPNTAVERGLYEPFNPQEALPKSAEFLSRLRAEFGNLGLAAAAYNAGPERVREFITLARDLPSETRNYVLRITGHSIEEWADQAKRSPVDLAEAVPFGENGLATCVRLASLLKQTELEDLEELSKVPSWCRHLHHPNVQVCGSVHDRSSPEKTLALLKLKSRFVSFKKQQ
jgi:hypothetical protein